MTQILEFKHKNFLIRSIAVFCLEQKQHSVLIMPYSHKNELGNSILIRKKQNTWLSESSLSTTFNSTYVNMIHEVEAALRQHEAFQNVFLQQFLS